MSKFIFLIIAILFLIYVINNYYSNTTTKSKHIIYEYTNFGDFDRNTDIDHTTRIKFNDVIAILEI